MAAQPPLPPPPLSTYRPSYERAPLGSGPRRGPPPPARPPAPKRGGGILLGLVYFFLFVVLAGAGGAGYLLLHPPSDLIQQAIARQIKANTGRDLVVSGPASFVLYPVAGVSLKNVSLSAPPGMAGNFVTMQSLDLSVKPLALLSRHLEIDTLVLRKPVFEFLIDKTGRNNWNFAWQNPAQRYAELRSRDVKSDIEPLELAAVEAGAGAQTTNLVANVKLRDVRVEDATLRINDERTGKVTEISSVNLKLALNSLEHPLVASGNFAWRGQKVDFEGRLSQIGNFFDQKSAHLSFEAKSKEIRATYDGGMTVDDGLSLAGKVHAQSDSARDLAKWFGTELPPVSGFGPLSIDATLATSGNVTSFSNAEFGLDGASAKGAVKVTTGGARPLVDANLAISELDLNKYLTSAVTGPIAADDHPRGAPPSPAAAPEQGATGSEPAPDEIEKLLNSQKTKVYGATQRDGWSSEQFNLALLGVADGNARLNVASLRFKNISVGRSSVGVAVANKVMKATFDDIELYQGHGKGAVGVNGTSEKANVVANFDLKGISALPFLKDAADFGSISGNANVTLQLSANGASQLQLVEGLNGKASFRFSDGAIVGFNLPGAIRGISNGDLSGLRQAPTEKTDFSELAATFNIANGVAQNNDLTLVSPLLRLSGAGTFHLPERTLDYTVKPKLVASLEGQAGDRAASGIELPVRISGSWDKPKYQADLKSVLSDPNKTVETVKELGKKFKGKSAGEIVDQLFGKKEGSANTGSSAGDKDNAKNLLNKFLGKQQDAN